MWPGEQGSMATSHPLIWPYTICGCHLQEWNSHMKWHLQKYIYLFWTWKMTKVSFLQMFCTCNEQTTIFGSPVMRCDFPMKSQVRWGASEPPSSPHFIFIYLLEYKLWSKTESSQAGTSFLNVLFHPPACKLFLTSHLPWLWHEDNLVRWRLAPTLPLKSVPPEKVTAQNEVSLTTHNSNTFPSDI